MIDNFRPNFRPKLKTDQGRKNGAVNSWLRKSWSFGVRKSGISGNNRLARSKRDCFYWEPVVGGHVSKSEIPSFWSFIMPLSKAVHRSDVKQYE
jgi:hypothetical protein